jgi:hypothetical protein
VNQSRLLAAILATSILAIAQVAHTDSWMTTAGVAASGSPASHGKIDPSQPNANIIANLGCPASDIPLGKETVVAQGEATAPPGTTAPTWELTTNGTIVLENRDQSEHVDVHVVGYIGVQYHACDARHPLGSCLFNPTPAPIIDFVAPRFR